LFSISLNLLVKIKKQFLSNPLILSKCFAPPLSRGVLCSFQKTELVHSLIFSKNQSFGKGKASAMFRLNFIDK
jgi:hypothetical protein